MPDTGLSGHEPQRPVSGIHRDAERWHSRGPCFRHGAFSETLREGRPARDPLLVVLLQCVPTFRRRARREDARGGRHGPRPVGGLPSHAGRGRGAVADPTPGALLEARGAQRRGRILREPIQDGMVGPGAEQMLYVQALERVHDLNDARRGRLVDAQEGLPALMWVVLVSGGVIVVGFTYLFGLGNTVVHALMIGALAAIISLSLFTVAALDYPFGRGVQVGPEAFEQVLGRFESGELSDL